MSLDREMDRLEAQLEEALANGDVAEAKAIQRDIRDLAREASERERWEEEGRERGWR